MSLLVQAEEIVILQESDIQCARGNNKDVWYYWMD
jgi:hypothetical protein